MSTEAVLFTQRSLPMNGPTSEPCSDLGVLVPHSSPKKLPSLNCTSFIRQLDWWQSSLSAEAVPLVQFDPFFSSPNSDWDSVLKCLSTKTSESPVKEREIIPDSSFQRSAYSYLFDREIGCASISSRRKLQAMLFDRIINVDKIHRNTFGLGQCFNLSYSSDSQFLLAAFEGGTIDLLHHSSERISRIFEAHRGCANNFCWMADKKFASCGDDSNVLTWDVRMLQKPMQRINLTKDNFTSDIWIKDLHFIPKNSSQPGMLLANCGNITRLTVTDGFDLEPLDRIFPSYGGLSKKTGRSMLLKSQVDEPPEYLLSSFYDVPSTLVSWPTETLRRKSVSENEPIAVEEMYPNNSVDEKPRLTYSYHGMQPDPTAFGFAAKRNVFGKSGRFWSYTAYFDFEKAKLGESDALRMRKRYFVRDLSSPEIHQEPAFSPNGMFIANPGRKKVDILTSGLAAEPFSWRSDCEEKPMPFRVASTLKFPNCFDINCCAASPRDTLTVASGCFLGHVHFAQPFP